MNFFNKFTSALLVTSFVSVISGCDAMFHDDLTNCPQGVYVNFYTKTACELSERPLGKVSKLHLLAFDNQQKLVAVEEQADVELTKDYNVLMPVGNGTYSFIAWTGATPTLFDNANLVVGETTKDDVMLALKQQTNGKYVDLSGNKLYQGETAKPVLVENPETHGSVYKYTSINLGEKTYRINVLVKLDKSLKGKVDIKDFVVKVTAGNGKLNINGTTPLKQTVAEYPFVPVTATDSSYTIDYTTLDLVTGRNNTISLTDIQNNVLLWEKDLIATVLLGSGIIKNPNVNLECDHDLTVEFIIGDKCKDCSKPSGTYVCAAIFVNNWQVHSYKYILNN